MDLYLPIAEMSVNALVIVALGLGVGFLSGMFGVGGGFLTTPLLIFYGIPPAIAVASSATQVTGASVSGALNHYRAGGVDVKMGLVMVGGGLVGAAAGSLLFQRLQTIGQVDVVIGLTYVALLGTIGLLMLKESLAALRRLRSGAPAPRPTRRHHPLVAVLPWRMRFPRSGLYISPLAPFLIGALVGVLTVIMGVGGGFILVPAMLYLLGMAAATVVGTSLFQIVFVTAVTTLLHAVQSQTVDIVLAALLLVGGVVGAQLGARMAQRLAPERLRLALALLVLAVALRLLVGLTLTPSDLYSIETALA
ncbi:sulfite exporter TauE/SafE family protein [Thermaurantiacus tibetensis]|uniref:sulfite exporter TauE/SafE family protein n=1 Tax=Thermaurantiacus tibetensis TaxID=2759035 RepID=UPI00188EDDF0|nr:sulfite exporter TauE/SafE family protein [Thermaurantiacus tibetensis]